MSAPTVRVEAEFGAGVFTWGGTGSFVDVTSSAFSFSISRGRNDYTQQFQAGTCTITLRNTSGEFDPDNAAGPYFGEIQPGRRIRITSNAASFIFSQRLFVGFITDITLDYELGGDAVVTITALDGLSLLAQQEIADGTAFVSQSTADRFLAVIALPEIQYPFLTGFATGLSTCAAGTASGNVLTYLAQVVTTEQGAMFVDRFGTLQFLNRYEILSAPNRTFSDVVDINNVNYEAIERLVTSLELFNELAANRTGEPAVIRNSATSKDSFGIRFLNLGEVLFGSDGEVTDMIDFAMVRFASTSPRVTQVTTLLDTKGQSMVAQLAQLELTESVTVEFTPPGVAAFSLDCSIESVRYDFTVGQGFRATYGFTPRDTSNYLVLNDATLGQLDANVLGF